MDATWSSKPEAGTPWAEWAKRRRVSLETRGTRAAAVHEPAKPCRGTDWGRCRLGVMVDSRRSRHRGNVVSEDGGLRDRDAAQQLRANLANMAYICGLSSAGRPCGACDAGIKNHNDATTQRARITDSHRKSASRICCRHRVRARGRKITRNVAEMRGTANVQRHENIVNGATLRVFATRFPAGQSGQRGLKLKHQ